MKKIKHFSLILCLCILFQLSVLPAAAAEMETAGVVDPFAQTVPTEAAPLEFGQFCIQQGCRTINGMVPLGGTDRKLETAQSVFLYEVGTDTVVYSYNPDMKVHPGSLAKIVLAMVVLENCDTDEIVTVTEGIQSYIPAGAIHLDGDEEGDGGSLKSLEQIAVIDLLYGVMLTNANDAAVALAHHVAGTTDAFLTMMNNRVRQIGCVNTEFGNISGLYTMQSYSTGRDMAKIMREAIKNEELMEIFAAPSHTIPATDLSPKRTFKTTNYFIDNATIEDFYDDRVKGGFQTYHESTGASIAMYAEYNSLRYIGVVLGAQRQVDPEKTWVIINHGNFNELSDLFEYGFKNFKVNRILYEGMSVGQFSVAGGESNAVGEVREDVDSVVPVNAQMNNLNMTFELSNKGQLAAPLEAGQMIGTMKISYLNSVMAEAEVYSIGPVKASNDTGVTIRSAAVRSDADSASVWSVIGTICVIVLGLAVAYLAYNSYMRSRMRARRKKRRAQRRRMR